MVELKLTTVKLLQNVYTDFKIRAFQTNFSLQKLVNRSVYLYVTDEKYRDMIHSVKNLQVSGSNF